MHPVSNMAGERKGEIMSEDVIFIFSTVLSVGGEEARSVIQLVECSLINILQL